MSDQCYKINFLSRLNVHSSNCRRLEVANFAKKRAATNRVAVARQMDVVATWKGLRLYGLIKLGDTPGGGSRAGVFARVLELKSSML